MYEIPEEQAAKLENGIVFSKDRKIIGANSVLVLVHIGSLHQII